MGMTIMPIRTRSTIKPTASKANTPVNMPRANTSRTANTTMRPSLMPSNTAKLVIAVLGLAVFGTAAAFGYRAIFKPSHAGPTPVIRADNSPTKVLPVAGDASQKPINERLGDGQGERLVRREEDPADLRSRANGSGVVGAGVPFQGTGAAPATVPVTGAAASGPASLTEPKRVRTVTIRSDQAAAPPAAPPPPRASAQRQAAVVQPGAGAAPVATAPDAPPARVPATPRAAGEGGGFVVQLSAQKSEAEAQATFRSMQAKYPALSGRQPLIRRKDTDKGVFYAAQVGPFGAKGDADQLCETLKSVGGNCFVQRN
jgi:cell division septation protein DedD